MRDNTTRSSLSIPRLGSLQPFVASHNKVICVQTIKNLSAASWGMGFETPSSLPHHQWRHFGGYVVFSAPNFQTRGLHGSLVLTSVVQFCVGTRAVCERRYRCASFESLSVLVSATGRRNSIGFRPYRRTPTAVVSRSLPRFKAARALPAGMFHRKKASDRRAKRKVRLGLNVPVLVE